MTPIKFLNALLVVCLSACSPYVTTVNGPDGLYTVKSKANSVAFKKGDVELLVNRAGEPSKFSKMLDLLTVKLLTVEPSIK